MKENIMAYTSEAINFLQGTGKSSSGHTLKQILLWDDDSWENEHDFIQWIFPNDKPSNFNPDCPVLDAKTINLMRIDPKVKEGVLKAYERFLGFCGLNHGEYGLEHEVFKNHIWGHKNHNWLRITRVLRCLSLLGCQSQAEELLCFVTSLKNVNDETIAYWKKAILTM